MTSPISVRLTIDEIERNRDGELVATLVDDAGRVAVIPLSLLPEDARVNQVVVAGFRIDEETTDDRRKRIRQLQHRLFNQRREME